jgi:hypothetical protein
MTAYDQALQTFFVEPEALTAEQINVLRGVDDRLADRAERKRADTLAKAAEVRHRAAMGQPPAKVSGAELMADFTLDHLAAALAHPRRRIRELEAKNEALERRLLVLEDLVISLQTHVAGR